MPENNKGEGITITVLDDDWSPIQLETAGGSNLSVCVEVNVDRFSSTGKLRAGGINVSSMGLLDRAHMERCVMMMQLGMHFYEHGCKLTKEMVDELKAVGVAFKFYVDEPK